MVQWVIEVWDV